MTTSVAGTDLYHRIDGPESAPVVVLGPSLGTDLHLFDEQVTALSRHYRIVRYDLPGHGNSPTPNGPYTMLALAEAVVALLDRLGIDRAHHVGVSIGGAIAQQLTVASPERVLSLTTIASAARFADPDSWHQRAATVRERGTEAMVASRPGVWFLHEFAVTAAAKRLLTMLRGTTREGYAGCCEAIATFDLQDQLHTVDVPVLAIAGAQDPATTPDMVRLIADSVPRGRFKVVANCAHLLNVEKPLEVSALLAEHLGTITTAGN